MRRKSRPVRRKSRPVRRKRWRAATSDTTLNERIEPPQGGAAGAGGDLRHDPERANRAAAGWGRAGGRLSDGGLFLSS